MQSKFTLFLALAAFFLFTTSSCQRALDEQDLIYIGSWSSKKFYLEIGANGYGFCQRRNRPAIEGRVRITNNRIIFNGTDENDGRRSFRIDIPPTVDEETGEIFMELNNKEFLKH